VSAAPAASIIIPAWNGTGYLAACLDSLLAQSDPGIEVIVVDDGSVDGTADLAERYARAGRITFARNPVNAGFAKTVNRGLLMARGDVLVLLNQDTVSPGNWLAPLLERMASDSRIGIAGCRLLYPDGRVQHAGASIGSRGEGAHFREDPPLDAVGLADVAFVTGAALAVSRRCFESIGPMDEGFARAYYEDVDWCYRARRMGFRVVYCPRAELIHAEVSAAAGSDIESHSRFHFNRLRFVFKHFEAAVLTGEFLDREMAWLGGLGRAGAGLGAAAYRAYFRHLVGLYDLARARGANLQGGDAPHQVDTIATVLITLRAAISL
jgi:O-antigen biosynthesis protein